MVVGGAVVEGCGAVVAVLGVEATEGALGAVAG